MKIEIILTSLLVAASATFAAAQTHNFDKDDVGKAPKEQCALPGTVFGASRFHFDCMALLARSTIDQTKGVE